jgi:hypothetical protein
MAYRFAEREQVAIAILDSEFATTVRVNLRPPLDIHLARVRKNSQFDSASKSIAGSRLTKCPAQEHESDSLLPEILVKPPVPLHILRADRGKQAMFPPRHQSAPPAGTGGLTLNFPSGCRLVARVRRERRRGELLARWMRRHRL